MEFEFDSRSNESIAIIDDNYRVRMVHDESPENPFTNDNGHWPMIVDYRDRGHNFTIYDKCKGAALDSPLDRFTDSQLIRLQKAIIAAMGGNEARYYNTLTGDYSATLSDDWQEHKRDYRTQYVKGRAGFAAMARDYFDNALQAISNTDKLDTYAALYDVLGIANLNTCSTGYNQGDYSDLLIVATPEAIAEFCPNATPDQLCADMKAQADLYGFWAWGDCYGAIVEYCHTSDSDWQEIDSCWGFFGHDADKSGVAEFAQSIIDWHKRDIASKRNTCLKRLIRNHVPLALRPALLAESVQ